MMSSSWSISLAFTTISWFGKSWFRYLRKTRRYISRVCCEAHSVAPIYHTKTNGYNSCPNYTRGLVLMSFHPCGHVSVIYKSYKAKSRNDRNPRYCLYAVRFCIKHFYLEGKIQYNGSFKIRSKGNRVKIEFGRCKFHNPTRVRWC